MADHDVIIGVIVLKDACGAVDLDDVMDVIDYVFDAIEELIGVIGGPWCIDVIDTVDEGNK